MKNLYISKAAQNIRRQRRRREKCEQHIFFLIIQTWMHRARAQALGVYHIKN